MRTHNRKQIAKEVQQRLDAGEQKLTIYNAMKDDFSAPAVEQSLAQRPYPADRINNQPWNYALFLLHSYLLTASVWSLSSQLAGKELKVTLFALPLIAITVLLRAAILIWIQKCNLIAYLLTIFLGIHACIKTRHATGEDIIPTILTLLSIALAIRLKRKLFPNTSWFLSHKRDASGTPIF
jgi:hypothetical protein